MDAGFTRRKELVCTLSEMEENGAVVLLDREVIYVRQDDGEYLIKIGDGKTALSDLPYATTKAKLYRHTIKISATYHEETPEGTIGPDDPQINDLTLVVYRSTETPLTLADITDDEMKMASIQSILFSDNMYYMRLALRAMKNGNKIYIEYFDGFDEYAGDNPVPLISGMSFTKYNFTDSVTEV